MSLRDHDPVATGPAASGDSDRVSTGAVRHWSMLAIWLIAPLFSNVFIIGVCAVFALLVIPLVPDRR